MKMKIFGVSLVIALLALAVAANANLGTVTAGSIAGVTATFGGAGGNVTLNSSGITITSGADTEDRLKWADGSFLQSNGDVLSISADGDVDLIAGTQVSFSSSDRIDILANGLVNIVSSTSDVRVNTLSGSGTAFVCVDNDGDLFASGSACATSAPEQRIAALELRIEELERAIGALLVRNR